MLLVVLFNVANVALPNIVPLALELNRPTSARVVLPSFDAKEHSALQEGGFEDRFVVVKLTIALRVVSPPRAESLVAGAVVVVPIAM